jgi:hypothetical protein
MVLRMLRSGQTLATEQPSVGSGLLGLVIRLPSLEIVILVENSGIPVLKLGLPVLESDIPVLTAGLPVFRLGNQVLRFIFPGLKSGSGMANRRFETQSGTKHSKIGQPEFKIGKLDLKVGMHRN